MFPLSIQNVEPDTNKELLAYFKGEREGFIQVGEQKWFLPARFARQASGYYQFPLRTDDVWIVTFPRSGTTWCQELIWLLNNNLDFKKSAEIPLEIRSPFFEMSILHDPIVMHELIMINNNDPAVIQNLKERSAPGYEVCKDLSSQRTLKTHFPLDLLPPSLLDTSRVVYVARNPKDVLASYYHHNKLVTLHGYRGDLPKYWKLFKENQVCYSPYWGHLKQAWDKRHHPNMLFIFYENLVKDLFSGVKEIATFLNVRYSDDQMRKVVDHLQINNFRRNVLIFKDIDVKGYFEKGEDFVRRGKVGEGDPELTAELEREVEEWIAAELQQTDIRFPEKK